MLGQSCHLSADFGFRRHKFPIFFSLLFSLFRDALNSLAEHGKGTVSPMGRLAGKPCSCPQRGDSKFSIHINGSESVTWGSSWRCWRLRADYLNEAYVNRCLGLSCGLDVVSINNG